ncbi:MAG: hypothetical protein KDD33_12240 [Bdellovibrionales bacterium]|nr:hypothetical protein [Bdellovibrionales bacterium]
MEQPIFLLNNQWKLSLELCHFCSEFNPSWSPQILQSQLHKLYKNLAKRVEGLGQEQDRLDTLIDYFFRQMGFNALDSSQLSLERCFLPYVLSCRQGPPELLMLLFTTLAEKIDLRVQVMACRKHFLLKVYIHERPQIVDVLNQGRCLQPYQIVDLINEGLDFASQELTTHCIVISYLNQLKARAKKEQHLQLLSLIHSYLMKYQPFNLRHISERALVAYQSGDYKKAAEDIRSYFVYKSPEVTNYHLRKIYKLARRQIKDL